MSLVRASNLERLLEIRDLNDASESKTSACLGKHVRFKHQEQNTALCSHIFPKQFAFLSPHRILLELKLHNYSTIHVQSHHGIPRTRSDSHLQIKEVPVPQISFPHCSFQATLYLQQNHKIFTHKPHRKSNKIINVLGLSLAVQIVGRVSATSCKINFPHKPPVSS